MYFVGRIECILNIVGGENIKCPNCDSKLVENEEVCLECGNDLTGSQSENLEVEEKIEYYLSDC
jgi:DNA-directed RNA polymerase subunit RPC12/RpoP